MGRGRPVGEITRSHFATPSASGRPSLARTVGSRGHVYFAMSRRWATGPPSSAVLTGAARHARAIAERAASAEGQDALSPFYASAPRRIWRLSS